MRSKIIIDTDPGIDDAQAIAFAIAHPEIELLGLTTVFGNGTVEVTTNNALTLLDIFGAPEVPVAMGASRPLVQDRLPAPDFVHGADGMGNLHLPSPSNEAVKETAAEFIVRTVNEHIGEVSLITIGPLTNIAQALELDSELASKTKQLIAMGGTVVAPGNVTPVAEANFICDPHAADLVLGEDWPASIVGLDVTLATHLYDSVFKIIKQQIGSVGEFLWESSRFYVDFYARELAQDSNHRYTPMHDASALVYLVQAELFETISGPARVVPDGLAVGQLILDRMAGSYAFDYWQNRPTVQAAIEVDGTAVRKVFLETLLNYF